METKSKSDRIMLWLLSNLIQLRAWVYRENSVSKFTKTYFKLLNRFLLKIGMPPLEISSIKNAFKYTYDFSHICVRVKGQGFLF